MNGTVDFFVDCRRWGMAVLDRLLASDYRAVRSGRLSDVKD
jgi:hypothetical protein